jgi:hypothetical protein
MTHDGMRRRNKNYGDSPVRLSSLPIASSRLASSIRGTASRLPFGSSVASWPPQPSACPRPSPHAVPRIDDASRGAASVGIARRRPDDDVGGFAMFVPPICRRDDGTTLFRSARSDEDGAVPNIAASGASYQTERDARAAQR